MLSAEKNFAGNMSDYPPFPLFSHQSKSYSYTPQYANSSTITNRAATQINAIYDVV